MFKRGLWGLGLSWKQFAAVDEARTMILPLRNPSPVGRERVPKAGEGMSQAGVKCFFRQRMADLETSRPLAEQGGAFLGQDAGQPMSYDH
jgi:hypothetical protein